MSNGYKEACGKLIEAGRIFFAKGWVPATSGNFSCRLDDGSIVITVSGKHKGMLGPDDFLLVDRQGKPLMSKKPSAETLLHAQIYDLYPEARCVLHPHTVNATVLSRNTQEHIILQDYELLKAFPGIDTHECSVTVPLFKNDQDIPRLSREVGEFLKETKNIFGYMIQGHGFYTWGPDVNDCIKQVEAFEFLFECEIKQLLLGKI